MTGLFRKESNFTPRVSMIGALPPLKGNAYYSMTLASSMAEKVTVDFVAFRKLYPEILYPGGVSDDDPNFVVEETSTLKISKLISYANPWSWVLGGFAVKARLAHLQWWSIPLTPIYVVILGILKFRRKKIVITVHNVRPHESSALDWFAMRIVLAFADGIIVHSEDNRQTLVSQYRFPAEKAFKVHMPVHDMYGGEELTLKVARNQIGVPHDSRVVLSFGNLREYKGIDCLIRAFSELAKTDTSVHLLIVGQPWSGWAECNELVDSLGIRDKTTMVLDYVPMSAVAKYFQASDVVVLPYRRFDAQSGVGNIGLAFGLPLIVTRVGGLPELVMDERVIVEPDKPQELAEALTEVLFDKALIRKLRKDSQVLRNRYSWSAAIDRTLEIYEQIQSRK